ncbi:hypothetical protein LL06_06225 [Hoeflea sp. BAL378]|uniref:PAS domain-containing sensor histidine kinase n=1 Tax=Hoeflea sp. BAL378 TaxID=1547437 RepID=UPI000513D395|nr:PAS domain S-box protein [Hoeflea sp. BAL378]KGF70230.1 hypothetical protein LL06_06225 [Hoeflea sp. BAL378]
MQSSAGKLIKALYETFPDPVLATDRRGRITAVNQAAIEVLGYAEAELLGMDPTRLEVPGEGGFYPERAASAWDANEGWICRNVRLQRKDGSVLAAELRQLPVSPQDGAGAGLVSMVRPVSETPARETDPADIDQLFPSALESISHGFAIYDQADRLLICNSAYRNMHEAFKPSIAIGRTFEAILREAVESGRYPDAGETPQQREDWIRQRLDLHNNPIEPYVQRVGADQWVQIEDRVTADNYRVALRADVTPLVRARSEAERLGFILEGVGQEIYLVNPKERRIVYANKAACDNLQYSLEELRAMDVRQLNADYSPAELTEKMQPLLTGKIRALNIDTRHRRKDGSIYVCRIRMELMGGTADPMILSFGEDITLRIDTEAELERKRTEFESLVRSLPDIISRAKPDTTLTYVNENYARFSGRRPEEMVGRKFMEFVAPDARQEVLAKISSLTPEAPMKTLERPMVDAAGRQCWYLWTNLMVYEDGKPIELVSVGREITESHQAREQIAHQTRELAARNDALEQFAGMISHDLKAPLRQVRLFADLIAEDVSSGKTDELGVFSAHISDRAKAMEQMISSLLEYSQLAYQSIRPSTFRFSEAVAEAWSNLAVHASEARARLIAETDAELHADLNLMIQLLQNLFANSIKYRMADRPVEVRVDVEVGDTAVSITVADNGIGIAPQHADSIFGVFKRLHRDERLYSGSGLGLALCRRIAESHGGTIVLDSSYRSGARFVITLPRVAP